MHRPGGRLNSRPLSIFLLEVTTLLYLLAAILMFGILITLHELGHFWTAKLCGVKVNEFSIGMGPLLLKKQGKETQYSLRAIPLGGYCAMEGEEEGVSSDPRAFPNRPWWQRLIILLAGVTMNFLVGVAILALLYAQSTAFYLPVVSGFSLQSAAQEQSLQEGDRILRVNGHAVLLTSDISFFLGRDGSGTADLVVERNGEKVVLNGYRLPEPGILGIYTTPVATNPGLVLRQAVYQALDYVRMVWYSLGDLVSGSVGIREVSGPVGIVSMVGEVGQEGAKAAESAGQPAALGAFVNILSFAAFISINLAVMNLLPIPGLDGGQVVFLALNGIVFALRGKKLDPKYQGWVTAASFVILLLLMAAVTVSDILKQFGV